MQDDTKVSLLLKMQDKCEQCYTFNLRESLCIALCSLYNIFLISDKDEKNNNTFKSDTLSSISSLLTFINNNIYTKIGLNVCRKTIQCLRVIVLHANYVIYNLRALAICRNTY